MDLCRIHKVSLPSRVGQSGPIIFLLLLAFFLPFAPAHAEVDDPFAPTVSSEWVTLDEYNQAAPTPPVAQVPDALAEPHVPHKKAELEPAQPARPLQLAAMPGLNKSNDATVMSSDEPSDELETAEKVWLKPEESHAAFKKQEKEAKLASSGDKTKVTYNIRLPALPSPEIKSIPASRVSQGKLDREAKADQAKKQLTAEAETSKIKEKTDACEALTEYRRRQLKALESDRKTLAQLKSVLSDLGLTTELSFMTNAGGSLSVAPKQEASSSQSARDTSAAPETKTP